jgi:serine protease Do
MKKLTSFFLVAFVASTFSLLGYVCFFEKEPVSSKDYTQDSIAKTVQTRYTSPSMVAAENTDFVAAAERSLNAVVHVKNTSVSTSRDPFADFFYGSGRGRGRQQVGTGSGVLISTDGYIITNNHVIDNADDIEITLNNKKNYKATLIGADATNDIALLKIEGTSFESIPFGNSDNVRVGEWVLAVGNPYNLTSTVTAGIVSAKGRDLKGNANIESFIQTDAAVNPGNSGGALVNTQGELIGINTAISSQTGSFVGYSFAVPSNIARKVVEDLMEFGDVQKALIGIRYDPRNDDLEGVRILEVTSGGGAATAGLQKEDVIVKIDNVKITQFSDLKGQLSAKRPGDAIQVTILRDSSLLTKTVVLTENKTLHVNALGFSVELLSTKELTALDLDYGVKITNIQNSELSELGVEEGNVLLEVNGQKVKSVSQVDTLLKDQAKYGFLKLSILNKNGEKENYIFR